MSHAGSALSVLITASFDLENALASLSLFLHPWMGHLDPSAADRVQPDGLTWIVCIK